MKSKQLTIKDELINLFTNQIENQNAKGLPKYGITLEDVDYKAHDWLEMANQELIDLAQYQQKEIRRLRNELSKLNRGNLKMLQEVTDKIRTWAIYRGLDEADPNKQALKLGEEFGELCEGLAKGKQMDVEDAIGDMYVVLTILSMQLGVSIESCIFGAYEEIQDRKGKMVDGVFVKESDLP